MKHEHDAQRKRTQESNDCQSSSHVAAAPIILSTESSNHVDTEYSLRSIDVSAIDLVLPSSRTDMNTQYQSINRVSNHEEAQDTSNNDSAAEEEEKWRQFIIGDVDDTSDFEPRYNVVASSDHPVQPYVFDNIGYASSTKATYAASRYHHESMAEQRDSFSDELPSTISMETTKAVKHFGRH